MKKTVVSATLLTAAVVGTYLAVTSTGPTTWNVTPTSTPSLLTAEQNAKPGDTIVLSGTWRNATLLPTVSGTASAPITYHGGTFDGAGTYGVANTAGHSYLVFDAISFTNSNYVTAPLTASRGVIVRNSSHVSFTHDTFTHVPMQLISSSDNTISGNTWRSYVASYVNGQPTTSGDALNLVNGSSRNLIQGNDMKYAGHSLIEVGNGFGGAANAANVIQGNTLDNPWYKDLILADDGAGTVVDGNQLLNANSVPTLLSTVHPGLSYSEATVQFSGKNFVLRNNTIAGGVGQYGLIGFGSRWYRDALHPNGVLVESTGNQVYGNTISGKAAAAFSFEENYTPGTDPSIPALTGNVIHDNVLSGLSTSGAYSWDHSNHFETVITRSYRGAGVWSGLGGNQFYANTGVSGYRYSYVNAAGATSTQVYALVAFQASAFDPTHVYGNS